MSDFLLEIGVEELPARFIDPALEQMREMTSNMLKEQRISFEEVKSYGTPRRLAVMVLGVSLEQESLSKEVKGPAVKVAYNESKELTKAGQGFARSQGVSPEELIVKLVGEVDYIFAIKKQEGRPTKEVLPAMCLDIINGLHFPKPMRWGNLSVRFARPIRWLLALFGEEVLDFSFAGLKASNLSYGHRFLHKEAVVINKPEDYVEALYKAYVMVDSAKRRALIWEQAKEVAKAEGGQAEENEELLNEVNNLLEWPTAFSGSFDQDFLRLPKEVLVTPMREHQRYFPVVDNNGALLNKFIGVKNGTADHLDIVRAGNEKVLRARLYDAAFFWDEDLKNPLINKVDELKKIVWQESLGSIYEKVERIGILSEYLANDFNSSAQEIKTIKRSALLCKADLVTSMVYEFTELQGIMGQEYANRNGEKEEVAKAIFEHYLPRFAGDILPDTLAGKALSMADKMDSLVGCFGIGIQPTGSQDPYALRRQALGICHIAMNGQLVLSLSKLISKAYDAYKNPQYPLTKSKEEVISLLLDFFAQRLKGILNDKRFSYGVIEAVLASGVDDIYGVLQKALALDSFSKEDGFEALLVAFNRANNLTKSFGGGEINASLLEDESEKQLFKALEQSEKDVLVKIEKRDYIGALGSMGSLRPYVDKFFESVMVMVEDEKLKNTRLALLKKVALLVSPIADLRKIV